MSRGLAELKTGMAPEVDTKFMQQTLAHVTFAGVPTGTAVPEFVGQECHDTVNNDWYKAHGLAAADWKKLTP